MIILCYFAICRSTNPRYWTLYCHSENHTEEGMLCCSMSIPGATLQYRGAFAVLIGYNNIQARGKGPDPARQNRAVKRFKYKYFLFIFVVTDRPTLVIGCCIVTVKVTQKRE